MNVQTGWTFVANALQMDFGSSEIEMSSSKTDRLMIATDNLLQ